MLILPGSLSITAVEAILRGRSSKWVEVGHCNAWSAGGRSLGVPFFTTRQKLFSRGIFLSSRRQFRGGPRELRGASASPGGLLGLADSRGGGADQACCVLRGFLSGSMVPFLT
jgi:hypothetical protein